MTCVKPLFECHFLFLISEFPIVVIWAITIAINRGIISFITVVHIASSTAEFFFYPTLGDNIMPPPNKLIPPTVNTKSVNHYFLFLNSSNVGGSMPSSLHFSLNISYWSSIGIR